MIIKAKERGGGRRLGLYLINANDNEQVEVHDVRGFISQDPVEALSEADAVSRGTKCKNHLFSVSLNPPPDADVPLEAFEDAATRIEEKVGLAGQPRVIVFHENGGRRHAHVVWSRIDSQKMKALNMAFYKRKMTEVSRSLFLDYGWKVPNGLIDKQQRNPLNFTLEEWQQAKRLDDDPASIKQLLLEAWTTTDSKAGFIEALNHRGFYLARGDRRGFVAVDWRGEVFSLSRWLKQKTKALEERLDDPSKLPDVEETKSRIDQSLADQVRHMLDSIRAQHLNYLRSFYTDREKLKFKHKKERDELLKIQTKRSLKEAKIRQARLRNGMKGLWDKLTGDRKRFITQNETEARSAIKRDHGERHQLRATQLKNRRRLQKHIVHLKNQERAALHEIKQTVFAKLPKEAVSRYEREFERNQQSLSRSFSRDI